MEEIIATGILLGIIFAPIALSVYALKNRHRYEERWVKRYSEYIERTGGRIVEVRHLGSGRTKQKRGGLGNVLLGGFFGGPIGAIVGSLMPGDHVTLERFAVRYSGGELEIREVRPNSPEYKELVAMLDRENI